MIESADCDVYEAMLIKKAMTPFNDILPIVLPEVRDKTIQALEVQGLNRAIDKTAYASNMLWSFRRYIEINKVDGWKLIGRRDSLHMIHEKTGLKIRFTKAFALTDKLSPAGSNGLRQKAYMQGKLRTEEEMLQLFDSPSLAGDVVHIVWMEKKGHFYFTAYIPKETGRYPHSPESWLAFPVGVSSSEYNDLAFHSDEEAPLLVPKQNLIVESSMVSQKKNREIVE